MSDPLHPTSSPSSKPENKETVIDGTETVNITYKKHRVQNFVIASLILQNKNSSPKDEQEIIKPQVSDFNLIRSEPTQNMSTKAAYDPFAKKPSFRSKLSSFMKRLSSFGGFFGSKKMSDKQPGRPMKYPYTLSAKIAQFPYKYYINNTWLWKYYFLAIAVSFPVFYKLSRASNTPENKKTWDEIRKRDFTPGGHH